MTEDVRSFHFNERLAELDKLRDKLRAVAKKAKATTRPQTWVRRCAGWLVASRVRQHDRGLHYNSQIRHLNFGLDGSVRYSVRLTHKTLRVVIQPWPWAGEP